RIGIIRIECGQQIIDADRIRNVVRENADTIERSTRRHEPARAPPPARRLVADETVESRRYATGPGRVAAERERHDARGHGNSGASARPAADVLVVEDACRDAVWTPGPYESRCELVEVCLADDDAAGALEPLDNFCRRGGSVGKSRTARRRGQPGNID